ncbi:type IV toxin-antitoxin system AbiEi family antitoxin domain-containing protein [Angustibacter peucedani]
MHPLPARLSEAARRQGGVFTTAQALDAGVDAGELQRAVQRRWLVRPRRGTYVAAELGRDLDPASWHVVQVHAAHLTLTGEHVVSHASAAAVHGLPLVDVDLTEVNVTAAAGRRSARHESGVWHHRGEVPQDQRLDVGILPVTALARTAFDVARVVPERSGLVVADAALAAGVDAAVLRALLDSCRDWPGSRRAARALLAADGRAESPGESLARWAFTAVGQPPDVLQLEVVTDRGTYRSDFGWREHRVVGEFDGRIKYGRLLRAGEQASDVAWRERQRELAIERAGWSVVRFTWSEVQDLALVRARLQQAFARGRQRALA